MHGKLKKWGHVPRDHVEVRQSSVNLSLAEEQGFGLVGVQLNIFSDNMHILRYSVCTWAGNGTVHGHARLKDKEHLALQRGDVRNAQ